MATFRFLKFFSSLTCAALRPAKSVVIVLEDRILREDFQVDSISTARLFGIAQSNQIPILTIDSGNVNTVLPVLPFAENVKEDIANAVNQGQIVMIPDQELSCEDWTGIGYIKENLATGESGWMLTGMIAGGMSILGPARWGEYLKDLLSNPFSGQPNKDPSAAEYIVKISGTDEQRGFVGMTLEESLGILDGAVGMPLKVKVLDESMVQVEGAQVLFRVTGGDGWLVDRFDNNVLKEEVTCYPCHLVALRSKSTPNDIYKGKGAPSCFVFIYQVVS